MLIPPYIRMLSSDWLMKGYFFLQILSFFSFSTIAGVFYTDISCLGGVFAKNTSRETKNFPSRMAREI
jgi:hypothetical protein